MVICRLLDLPTTVQGFTALSPDGSYNIYLNARHSWATCQRTYQHELAHIQLGHFNSADILYKLEQEADLAAS